MKIFKLFIPVFLILIGSSLFGAESQSKATLGEIEICSVDPFGRMHCVKRTAWIPEGRKGQRCSLTFENDEGKIVNPAANIFHKEIAEIQKKLGLNQIPLFVYSYEGKGGEM